MIKWFMNQQRLSIGKSLIILENINFLFGMIR